MTRDQNLGTGRSPNTRAVTMGLPLATVWAFQTAAADVPGAGYVRLPILFGMATAILAWRLSSPHQKRRSAHKNGVTLGFCCWCVAATFSALLHWQAAQVPLTYLSVFLAGGAVYLAFSGLRYTPADLDSAIIGLSIGTLFAIGASVVAFAGGHTITGNPGHMAGVLLIVAPILVSTAVESRKSPRLRVFCGATLIPVALGLFVLQQRAAFVTISLVVPLVCMFKLGVRRLPVFAATLVGGVTALTFTIQPDVALNMESRLLEAVTAVTSDAFSSTWLIGNGPGAGSIEAMETGILGLLGVVVLSIGVTASLCRIMARGRADKVNDTRFLLIIGPAAYLLYSLLSDSAPENAGVTTWTVLVASMLALMPPFGRRVRVDQPHAKDATPERSSPSRYVQRPQSIPSLAR